MNFSRSSYDMTTKGLQLADQFWALAILDVLESDKFIDDNTIAELVGLTDCEIEIEELHRHAAAMEGNGLVELAHSMDGLAMNLTSKGATFRKHRPLNV